MNRFLMAVGLPTILLILAIGMSALTSYLQTFMAGRLLMLVVLVAVLARSAYIGWKHNDDDAKP